MLSQTASSTIVAVTPIILGRIIRRQFSGRGPVEHIVDHLSAVEHASVDHLMRRRRVRDCCKPKETYLALPQSLESWHHVIEHLLNAERFPAAGLGDRVLQVEDVDLVETKSRPTTFKRLRYLPRKRDGSRRRILRQPSTQVLTQHIGP
jgi:hypothetical protein